MGYYSDLWNLNILSEVTCQPSIQCHKVTSCSDMDGLCKMNEHYNYGKKYYLSWLLIYSKIVDMEYEHRQDVVDYHGFYPLNSTYNHNYYNHLLKIKIRMVAYIPYHFSKFDSYDRIKSYK
jgi:hypothetical protein